MPVDVPVDDGGMMLPVMMTGGGEGTGDSIVATVCPNRRHTDTVTIQMMTIGMMYRDRDFWRGRECRIGDV